MDAVPDLARIAQTIGDATRIRMLTLLMEGRALTAKELAHGSGITPATATAHLRRLVEDGLVQSATQGRHKYFRLASADVAQCIESLLVIARPSPQTEPTLEPMQRARFCYDHLAGRLGVAIADTLLKRRLIRAVGKDFSVSAQGEKWFQALGIDLESVSSQRRRYACRCLDWTERRDHLGGALGAALANQFVESGWIKRRPGTRVAVVSAKGSEVLAAKLGIHWS